MVKDDSLYVFLGQDSGAKQAMLDKLRQSLFGRDIEEFNLDILYAADLTLKTLQEKLSQLPVQCKRRLVVIKCAHELHKDVREYLCMYVRHPSWANVLVIDIDMYDRRDSFVSSMTSCGRTMSFKDERPAGVFDLSRNIENSQAFASLKMLDQLLRAGTKPEMILGALRVSLNRPAQSSRTAYKRTRLLLECDLAIKTGKLKPYFALERLIIQLCGLSKPVRQA